MTPISKSQARRLRGVACASVLLPSLWLAGCSVLVVRCPGAQLILPGVPAPQAQALAAALTEDAP